MRVSWEDYGAFGLWTLLTVSAAKFWRRWRVAGDEEDEKAAEPEPRNPRPHKPVQPAQQPAEPCAAAQPSAPPSSGTPGGRRDRSHRDDRPDWDRLQAEAVAVDLIALLERRGYRPVWRRKDGEKATFHVPWRPDRHPSLGVYRRGSVWYWTDHARDESGTAIQALQRLDGLSRAEAILQLTGRPPSRSARGSAPPAAADPAVSRPDPDREQKKRQARDMYVAACRAMTPARAEQIARYWRDQGLRAAPDIGAVFLDLETAGQSRPYVGIPLPNAERVWALECRLLDGRGPEDRLWRARTYGPKDLWVHWRQDPATIMVAESILDALSAPELWPDWSVSLVALNGVGNVRLLPTLIRQAAQAGRPIRAVHLALDADAAGQDATRQAKELLAPLGVEVAEVTSHVQASVKDLNKLLRLGMEQRENS